MDYNNLNRVTSTLGRKKLLFTMEWQLVNIGGIMEIDEHYLAAITVLFDSSKP